MTTFLCSAVTFFLLTTVPHHLIRSGEEVPTAEPSGSHEGESSHGRGEEQTFCLPRGGEEPRPHSEVGGEVEGIHRQLLGTFWTRWNLGRSRK